MLIHMVDTPDIIKQKYMDQKNPLKVKYIAVKSPTNLYGFSRKYIKRKARKLKCNIYGIKKVNVISWIHNVKKMEENILNKN